MRKVTVDNLYEGLKFSSPVFMEDDIMLVPAGIPIRKKDLATLATFGITTVYSDGYPLPNDAEQPSAPTSAAPQSGALPGTPPSAPRTGVLPGTPPSAAGSRPGDSAPDSRAEAGNVLVYQKLKSLIIQLDSIFKDIINLEINKTNVKTRVSLAVRQLWSITAEINKIVGTSRADSLSFILCGKIKGCDLAKSSINTAILSMLIAEEMDFKPEKVIEIIAGALLHDIGMLYIPAYIATKKDRLTPDETDIIKSHTSVSYRIIHQQLLYPDEVAIPALQHHERWDGSGYPNGIAGRAIIVAARIICITDAFEAMVCEKPYRTSMSGYHAMKTLVSSNTAQFSPDVLRAFVKIMGIYPIGSGVTLNDGRIAQVIQLAGDTPLRPVVKIVANPGAKKISDGEVIDLLKAKQIFITQPIDLTGF
jgi:HD-GYP domain-containing protein (c-di-GMP phosphodiesterase class II)